MDGGPTLHEPAVGPATLHSCVAVAEVASVVRIAEAGVWPIGSSLQVQEVGAEIGRCRRPVLEGGPWLLSLFIKGLLIIRPRVSWRESKIRHFREIASSLA